jgi:[acyl-carrier-protein] S-malonyltransferase
LIRGAEKDFRAVLDGASFGGPKQDVVFNVTAAPESDPIKIKELMARQLCSPVRWYDSMCRMQEDKVDVFAEVGPKKVLTGMLRKIIPDDYEHEVYNVDSMKGLEAFFKGVT